MPIQMKPGAEMGRQKAAIVVQSSPINLTQARFRAQPDQAGNSIQPKIIRS